MAATIRPEPSFEEAQEIRRFWQQNHERLLAAFPEQFVAVKDGHVVAADCDLVGLFRKLRALKLDARRDVAIDFVTAHAGALLL